MAEYFDDPANGYYLKHIQVSEKIDKLLKDISKETGLIWHWHSTVVEPYPIGVAHKIVCEFPVRGGGTRYKWFEVQDILLYTNPELIIEHLKEEINKARKGEYK